MILIYNLLLCGAPQLILSRYISRPHVCFASNVINITLCSFLLVLVPVRAFIPVANSSPASLAPGTQAGHEAETPGSRKPVAWRHKLLIKGAVHRASAGQPTPLGKGFAPAVLFTPLCGSESWDARGCQDLRTPGPQRTGKGWAQWGAAPVERLFAALLVRMSAQGCCRTEPLASTAKEGTSQESGYCWPRKC